ncbi:coiled-coil-helix-coiled-coil-helix domain-containing protein [Anaeramoeba flamelloides]|uniref:Coiled-coil-helix-coiled-coil-helix domain-containing protein n=1 Tax=Anaeramoeba flamelloides TaxID=1746091 RepID=A0AAV7ZP90_9EUKA|nr:coiled-coil-helix-coiled-coil-helix domain-containing protein [Anaeramoeba flamelloides]
MAEIHFSDIQQSCRQRYARLRNCIAFSRYEGIYCSRKPLERCTKDLMEKIKLINTHCKDPFQKYKHSILQEDNQKITECFESLWKCMLNIDEKKKKQKKQKIKNKK